MSTNAPAAPRRRSRPLIAGGLGIVGIAVAVPVLLALSPTGVAVLAALAVTLVLDSLHTWLHGRYQLSSGSGRTRIVRRWYAPKSRVRSHDEPLTVLDWGDDHGAGVWVCVAFVNNTDAAPVWVPLTALTPDHP